jgi:hypothetical protein
MVCGDYSQATTVELRSSSFTLGNASELPFLSLNHDLLTVFNIDTLGGRRTELLSGEVV